MTDAAAAHNKRQTAKFEKSMAGVRSAFDGTVALLQEAAEEAAAKIRDAAPVDTGHTKSSIKVKHTPTGAELSAPVKSMYADRQPDSAGYVTDPIEEISAALVAKQRALILANFASAFKLGGSK